MHLEELTNEEVAWERAAESAADSVQEAAALA